MKANATEERRRTRMRSEKILKLNDIKTRNMLALLGLLLEHESLSRIELARKMNCDNATVTRVVRDLLGRGLLVSSGRTELRHGRPREQLSLNPDGRYIIGIALAPDGITGTVTDLRGRVKVREQVFFPPQRTRELFLETLGSITSRLLQSALGRLAGVGVSTFGAGMGVMPNNTANFPELNGLRLQDFFLENFRLRPEFSDMMICRMYYELIRHRESRSGSVLFLSAGNGIGMAAAIDGKIVFSRERHGGELGHNICEPDGLPCACGRRGCLETRCSSQAILRKARELFRRPGLTFREFAGAYRNQEPGTKEIVEDAVRFLSVTLANLLNNLAPDRLIFSGELSELGDKFFDLLEMSVRNLLFPFAEKNLTFVRRDMDDECDAVGAALLVTAKLLSEPEEFEKSCPHLPDVIPDGEEPRE